MLIKITKKAPIVEGNFLVMVSAISEERAKIIKGIPRQVFDMTFKPVGKSKGFPEHKKEVVIPDDYFDGSVLHQIMDAADPDFDIDALEEYDSDSLLKKKLVIKVKKGKGKKHEFANIVAFYPADANLNVVAFETDKVPSTKKRKKK
jgi:hypothetical protein